MAEALFAHDFWRVGQPRVSVLARLPEIDAMRRRTDLGELTSQSADFGEAAICVVRAQPEMVSRLLATDPASSREEAVMGELSPHVESCADVERVRFNRVSLRGFWRRRCIAIPPLWLGGRTEGAQSRLMVLSPGAFRV